MNPGITRPGPMAPPRFATPAPRTFGEISQKAHLLYYGGLAVAILAALAGFGALYYLKKSHMVVSYAIISLPCLALLLMWSRQSVRGIPILPVFILQQGLIYGLPLVVGSDSIPYQTEGMIGMASRTVGLLLLFSGLGWFIGRNLPVSLRPSKWQLSFTGGESYRVRTFNLGFTLLVLALVLQIVLQGDIILKLLPGALWRFLPVVRTVGDVCSMFGALLGAMSVEGGGHRRRRIVGYWAMVGAIFFLSISDVLISSAMGLVAAASIGVALGKGKIPWKFLIASMALVGFLNQGKFEIRERYWGGMANTTNIAIHRLPSFYYDWAKTSSRPIFQKDPLADGRVIGTTDRHDRGQFIIERINNLGILVFAVDAIEEGGVEPLNGETYALVPRLLIPRFLWPDKPRTHEGQVRLNLHFGRQSTVEQTEQTYIAWGLLPEAVGNFGRIGGPIFLGTFLGMFFGYLERISIRKHLFSIEGLVLAALLLKVAISFEMVASVLVTSTFQFVVGVILVGIFLRIWFGTGADSRAREKAFYHRPRPAPEEPESLPVDSTENYEGST